MRSQYRDTTGNAACEHDSAQHEDSTPSPTAYPLSSNADSAFPVLFISPAAFASAARRSSLLQVDRDVRKCYLCIAGMAHHLAWADMLWVNR